MSDGIIQSKGGVSVVYGAFVATNLKESSISYDIGEIGDVVSSLDAVVHLRKNKNAVVSSVTINIVKGAKGLNTLLALIATDVPYPMVINDKNLNVKLVFESASATQISIDDTSGSTDVEGLSFQFKGNLKLLEL